MQHPRFPSIFACPIRCSTIGFHWFYHPAQARPKSSDIVYAVCMSALVIINIAQTQTKMSLEPKNQSTSVQRLWGGTCWYFTIAKKCTRAICRIAAYFHGDTMILICSPKRWNWMESCSNVIWPKMEDEAAPFYAVAPWYTFYPIHWHYNGKR